ncbi:hypothetical protein OSTOST_02420 [Ostertagia ostertagi]
MDFPFQSFLFIKHEEAAIQGVADIYSLINCAATSSLRESQLFNEFFLENRQFLANYEFRSTCFTLYLRDVGITLMSLQRLFLTCPASFFVIIHWCSGLLLASPLFQVSEDVKYLMTTKVEISISPTLLALVNVILLSSCTTFFAICVICYALIFIHILHNKLHKNQSRSGELRLCGQVAGLVVGFLVQFVYNGGVYVLNNLGQATILRSWRTMGPLRVLFSFLCAPVDMFSIQSGNKRRSSQYSSSQKHETNDQTY